MQTLSNVPVYFARSAGVWKRRCRKLRKPFCFLREIAFVGNADDIIAGSDPKQYFRCTRQQTDDAHDVYTTSIGERDNIRRIFRRSASMLPTH